MNKVNFKSIISKRTAESLGLIKVNPDNTITLAPGDYIISSNMIEVSKEDIVLEELERSFNKRNWRLKTPHKLTLKIS